VASKQLDMDDINDLLPKYRSKRNTGCGYSWADDATDVHLWFPIGDDIKAADIEYLCADGENLTIGVKKSKKILIKNKRLYARVIPERSIWEFEVGERRRRFVHLILEKFEQDSSWGYFCEKELPKVGNTDVGEQFYMDIEIDGEPVGRIVFGMFTKCCSQTIENFYSLCTGTKLEAVEKMEKRREKTFDLTTYAHSLFFKIEPGKYIQGGDIVNNDGTNGKSAYWGEYFDDENFLLDHDKKYLLSMIPTIPGRKNTNTSQFVITAGPVRELDGVGVVFGQVVEGTAVVDKMLSVPLIPDTKKPSQRIAVAKCGAITPPPKVRVPYVLPSPE